MACSKLFASILYVPDSTSTNTGMRLFCIIGLRVVGNVEAGVIISSPGLQ